MMGNCEDNNFSSGSGGGGQQQDCRDLNKPESTTSTSAAGGAALLATARTEKSTVHNCKAMIGYSVSFASPASQVVGDDISNAVQAPVTADVNQFVASCQRRLQQLVSQYAVNNDPQPVDYSDHKDADLKNRRQTSGQSRHQQEEADWSTSASGQRAVFNETDFTESIEQKVPHRFHLFWTNSDSICRCSSIISAQTAEPDDDDGHRLDDRLTIIANNTDGTIDPMEIDLDGALKRFDRYCCIYSDSPLSNYVSSGRLRRDRSKLVVNNSSTTDNHHHSSRTYNQHQRIKPDYNNATSTGLASFPDEQDNNNDDRIPRSFLHFTAEADRGRQTPPSPSPSSPSPQPPPSPPPPPAAAQPQPPPQPLTLDGVADCKIDKYEKPVNVDPVAATASTFSLDEDDDDDDSRKSSTILHGYCVGQATAFTSYSEHIPLNFAVTVHSNGNNTANNSAGQLQLDQQHSKQQHTLPTVISNQRQKSTAAAAEQFQQPTMTVRYHQPLPLSTNTAGRKWCNGSTTTTAQRPLAVPRIQAEDLERMLRRPYFATCNSDYSPLNVQTTQADESALPSPISYLSTVDFGSSRATTPSQCNYGGSHQHQQQTTTSSSLSEEYQRYQKLQRQKQEELEQTRQLRRQKYKAKIDRAKKEFLESRASISDLFKSREEFAKKFKISMEQMDERMRDPEAARGPYLEYLSRSGNLHIRTDHQAPVRYVPKKSPFDRDYQALVDRAERMWAAYERRRANSRQNLYARSRAFSTGFLESTIADVANSPTDAFQTDETDLDEVHQQDLQTILVDHISRRDSVAMKDRPGTDAHSRARSVDYLMNKANREEAAPPENQLQRIMGGAEISNTNVNDAKLSIHELRFKKSTDQLHLPDWYVSSRYASGQKPVTNFHQSPKQTRPASSNLNHRFNIVQNSMARSHLSTAGISCEDKVKKVPEIPVDFFHKYKDEIETLRKSRSELNQLRENDQFIKQAPLLMPTSTADRSYNAVPPVPVATVRPTQLQITETYTIEKKIITNQSQSSSVSSITRQLTESQPNKLWSEPIKFSNTKLPAPAAAPPPAQSAPRSDRIRQFSAGYTVSAVPSSWNVPKQRDSVVIDVVDPELQVKSGSKSGKPGESNITLEEALDSILSLPGGPSRWKELDESLDADDAPRIRPLTPTTFSRPAVFSDNDLLMDRCRKLPNLARKLLHNEPLWVRCSCCNRTVDMDTARGRYISCRHCYTYYCSYGCRSDDWFEHKHRCTYARVNTVCKEAIVRVKKDLQAQRQMSAVAQGGYNKRGRGSVNLRFLRLDLARQYIANGWSALIGHDCLYYFTISDLIEMGKSADLIQACRQYDPTTKFILSVSVVVEIDKVPVTPSFGSKLSDPSEPYGYAGSTRISRFSNFKTQSLPPARRVRSSGGAGKTVASQPASVVLKSVLKSLENIAPSAVEQPSQRAAPFNRSNQLRHTVDSGQRSARSNSHVHTVPHMFGVELAFPTEVDETEV
ncbi:Uncharacterized protein T4B_5362 [Trichinella pseudospiralis]|uniref:Apical junction molecule ajm1 alpha/beta domain-containing protein n=1 Tax=Trichinella pseudospiralis TaxID=6337 RepID=A0A0V1J5U6_TRIPS|nr:Uncharacterized protein T4B_5362 [Trichinella pseudospiralis]KRZ41076.1 Uncharacterized protein T4C_2419 [Trichinella pseudospiralis]